MNGVLTLVKSELLKMKGMPLEWVYSTESLSTFLGIENKEIIGVSKGLIVVKKIDKSICNRIIIKNHYSHKTATDSHTLLHLGVYYNNELKGAMQYGYAMNPQSCNKIVADTQIDEYYELNRLWLDDSMPKNSETAVISLSIRLIKKINPKIKWIQSFADGRVGVGTIYKASSFVYCGSHKTQFVDFAGKMHHGGKFTNKKKTFGRMYGHLWETIDKHEFEQYRYIFFIDKNSKSNLLLNVAQYPVK